MQVFGIFLILSVCFVEGKCGANEGFDKLVHALNHCDETDDSPKPATAVIQEVIEALHICTKIVVIKDSMCTLPCLANELGLVNRGNLVLSAVSGFLYRQFKSLDADKRGNWTDGIKKCFKKDETSAATIFPIGYNNCSQQKEELINLGDCIIAARNCTEGKGRVVGIDDVALVLGGILAGLLADDIKDTLSNNLGCFGEAWCRAGKCAVDCDSTFVPDEWCHSTKSFSQSYEYVACTCDEQCSRCWKCAAGCTAIGKKRPDA